MMMVKAETAHERGLSAAMREIPAAYGEAAEAVSREKKAGPDAGTEFRGMRQPRSAEHGAQIWDPLQERNNAWLGTFGTATRAYDAAAVELHRAAAKTSLRSPAAVRSSAGVTVVKEESAEEHGDGESAEEYCYNDGKTYRFFEPPDTAVHGPAGAAYPVATAVGPSAVRATPVVGGNLSFPTYNTEEEDRGKRERTSEGGAAAGAGSGEMMGFFEGLTKQAVERQEAIQHLFVKIEQERVIREEAWRRLEMARLAQDQEILAQERAIAAATRDASMLPFIQKITAGQTIPSPYMPPPPPSSQTIAYAAAAPSSSQPPPLVAHHRSTDIVMMRDASGYDGSAGGAASSSRWTEPEEHALIQLRHDLYMRRDGRRRWRGLWDEVSAGMRRMGYSRSSLRCREKWWNMNNYFKKMESNNKRPEESKTFYRFRQLEAFHRYKAALGFPAGAGGAAAEHAPPNAAPRDRVEAFTATEPHMSQMAPQPHSLPLVDKYGGNGHIVSGGTQMQEIDRFVFREAGGRAAAKKAQTIDLNKAPVAAPVNSNVEVRRRAVATSDPTSGFRGVRLYGGKYYLAQIMEPGRPAAPQHLGIFDTMEEATRAYDAAALRLYGAAAKTNSGQPPMGHGRHC